MEPIKMLIGLAGGVVIIILAFLAGKWMDTVWRMKMLRSLTKKDWILVFIRNRDGRTLMQRSVLPENGTITFKGSDEIWLAKNSRIYRFDKEDQGFKFSKNDLKYQEGVPCLFVDYDDVKPIDFSDVTSKVTPGELGVWTKTYIDNEVAKDRETAKKLGMLITLALIISLISVAVGGFNLMKTMDLDNHVAASMNATHAAGSPQVINAVTGQPVNGPGVP